jgi:hypothetical protein
MPNDRRDRDPGSANPDRNLDEAVGTASAADRSHFIRGVAGSAVPGGSHEGSVAP